MTDRPPPEPHPDTGMPTEYVGDGVYVLYSGYSLHIRKDDHRNEASDITLEPHVLQNTVNWARRMGMEIK